MTTQIREIKFNGKKLGSVKFDKREDGKFIGVGYWGKSKKSFFYSLFNDMAELEIKIARFEGQLIEREKVAIDRRNAQKLRNKAFKESIKVGSILCDSWGYEQTNVEFYEVLTMKGATITLKELSHENIKDSEGFMCSRVKPFTGEFRFMSNSKIETKRVVSDNVKMSDSVSLTLWDERPMYKSWYY